MERGDPDPDYILRGSDGPVTSACFLGDGGAPRRLLSGTQNGSLSSWDLKTRRTTHVFSAHDQRSLLSIHDLGNDQIITQGRDGHVYLWQLSSGAGYHKLDTFRCAAQSFCPCRVFTLDEKNYLATTSENQSQLDLISMDTGNTLRTLTPETNCGMCLDMSVSSESDQPQLFVSYEDGSVALWDLRQGRQLSRTTLCSETMMAVDFNSRPNRGVCGSVDTSLHVWTKHTDQSLELVKQIEITNPGINCIRIRPDGKLFATGGWDSRVRMFSMKSLKPLTVLSYHTDSIQCLTFSSDLTLAVGSKDTSISLWSLYK